jgi:hypothetical protein
VEITAETMRGIDPATRDALLFGDAAPDAPAARPASPAAPTPAPETEPEKILPNRISTAQFDTREQEAIALKHELKAKGENITLGEACARVDVKYAGPKAAAEPTPDAIPNLDTPTDPIALLQQEADALAAEIDGKADDLITPEFLALSRKYERKMAEIDRAQLLAEFRREQSTERQQASQTTARESSKAEVLADWPTANNDDSLLGAEVARNFHEIAQNPAHPEYARYAQDDGPKWLTEKSVDAVKNRLVTALGYTPEQALAVIHGKPAVEAKGPAAAVTQPASAVIPRTLPVTSPGANPPANAPTIDPKVLLEQARNNPAMRDAALFTGSTSIGLY